MNRWKKLLFICGIILFALALTGVILWGLSSMKTTLAKQAEIMAEKEIDPIESFRTVRQQLRAMQKAQLNDIAHDAGADNEIRNMAQSQLLQLCKYEEQENTLEGILSMRGWENPVVTVHTECVNVLLQAESVSKQESAVILDLVCRQTGTMSGNVKIIPIK